MPHRIDRINQVIRKEISELLQRQIKDPRLSDFVCVTDVTTSPDLKQARVFVSCITTEEGKKEILKTLTGASSFLRRELIKRLNLRHVPELSFEWDDSIERGDRLLRLIDQVASEDEK